MRTLRINDRLSLESQASAYKRRGVDFNKGEKEALGGGGCTFSVCGVLVCLSLNVNYLQPVDGTVNSPGGGAGNFRVSCGTSD
jgi:hypothetical protein